MIVSDSVPLIGNNYDISKRIQRDYIESQYLWQSFWREASINNNLEAGIDPISQNGIINPRQQFYLNRVRPMINMVSGRQRTDRKSSIVVPLDNGSQQTADQLTKLLMGIFKRENVYNTISEAFHYGALISGMSLIQVYLDFSNDPVSGDIRVAHKAYNSFYFDPYFRDPKLSDCSFIGTRTYMTHESAAALLPDKYYDDIMAMPGGKKGATWDGKFQYMPESQGQGLASKVAYDEYYYKCFRKQEMLVDQETGEVLDISNNKEIDVDLFLSDNPTIKLIKQTIPTVKMAIMVQGRVFYEGAQPLGIDKYPFAPVLGFYNPALNLCYERMQSLCTALRDPQALFNKQVIQNSDAFDSQLNTGWMVKEGAVLDVDQLYRTGPGRVVSVKKGYDMSDIQAIMPAQISQAAFTIEERRAVDMNFVTGITAENMGQIVEGGANESGYKTRLKQSAGMMALEPLFDKLDGSQTLLSEIILDVARSNYTPAKIRTIIGEEPSPYFYSKEFGKYQCTVEMGFDTVTQKQMQFAQLMDLQQVVGATTAITKALIDSATIQNKEQLMQNIEQEQKQASESAQAKMQAEIEQLKANIEAINAKAKADMGLYYERTSRVAENQSLAIERIAEANKDDEQATLNKVKAMKELAQMDLAEIEKLITIANLVKQGEINQQQEVAQFVPPQEVQSAQPEQAI